MLLALTTGISWTSLLNPTCSQAAEEKAAAEAAAKVSDSVILETNGALKELCIMGLQTSILLARIYKAYKRVGNATGSNTITPIRIFKLLSFWYRLEKQRSQLRRLLLRRPPQKRLQQKEPRQRRPQQRKPQQKKPQQKKPQQK